MPKADYYENISTRICGNYPFIVLNLSPYIIAMLNHFNYKFVKILGAHDFIDII